MIGGLGIQELLIVFVIALVLFGGKKLPEVGQNLGKALRNFKAAEEEVRQELEDAVKEPPAPEEKPEESASENRGESENEPGKEKGSEETADSDGKNS